MARPAGRTEAKKNPAITVPKVLALMHLRDGAITDHQQLAELVGLYPNQVRRLLTESVEVLGIRCEKCGGNLTCVPCVACRHRRQYPRYKVAEIDCCGAGEKKLES